MFILSILFLLFSFNLLSVVTHSGAHCLREARFWLSMGSLGVLAVIMLSARME